MKQQHPERNRDRNQIYYNVLKCTLEPKRLTVLYRREILAHTYGKSIVKMLIKYGFIESVEYHGSYRKTQRRYQTSERGKTYLDKMSKLYEMLPWLYVEYVEE